MLFRYLRRVQRLIRDQRQMIINPIDIIDYVNEARNQLCGDAECIRYMGNIGVTAGTQVYPFSAITLTGGSTAGIGGVLNVRTVWYQAGVGQVWARPRPFEWFGLYYLNSAAPASGPPAVWSQYAQGEAGSIYLGPLPDSAYVLNVDCVCYPITLTSDQTVEAIPPLWTDAVPYYATYLAMLSMETGGSQEAADKMFQRYQQFVARGRNAATPSVLPGIYPQVPNPTRPAQLGQAGQRGAA